MTADIKDLAFGIADAQAAATRAGIEAGERSAQAEIARLRAVAAAARALLDKIDNMTTEEFERGREKAEREALRAALAKGE